MMEKENLTSQFDLLLLEDLSDESAEAISGGLLSPLPFPFEAISGGLLSPLLFPFAALTAVPVLGVLTSQIPDLGGLLGQIPDLGGLLGEMPDLGGLLGGPGGGE